MTCAFNQPRCYARIVTGECTCDSFQMGNDQIRYSRNSAVSDIGMGVKSKPDQIFPTKDRAG